MTEKKYTILISCIACILAFVLALFVHVPIAYAAESEDDTSEPLVWMFWNIYDDDKDATTPNVSKEIDFPSKDVFGTRDHLDSLPFPAVAKEGCAYNYHVRRMYTNSYHLDNYTWSSESEIVGFLWANKNRNIALASFGVTSEESYTPLDIVFVSMSDIYSNLTRTDYYSADTNEWSKNMDGPYNESNLIDKKGTDSSGNEFWTIENYFTGVACKTGFGVPQNMKIFKDPASAYSYLTTGTLDGLVSGGSSSGTSKKEYDSGLLLNDFDVQFHDSNKFEECYLDIKYTIPDSLKSVGSFQIDMEEEFDWIANVSGGLSDVTDSHTGTNYIDVLNHAHGFRIYLKDIKAIDNFINKYDGAFDKALKRFVLGNLNYVNFPFSKYVIGSVKTSNLNIKFHLVADKKYGHYVDYNLNLLSGVGVKNSYVPDTDGNYTSNNDSKVNGHYYSDVGTDAAGNTTYNYYYYYPDGGKEKVSSEDAANNTITNTVQEGAIKIDNSPTFTNNNNITIEGDTISNSANSYADSKSDATTNKSFIDKFLGFFEIIENNSFLGVFGKIFGWLPPGVSSLVTTALGIIVGIRVFKAFH